MARDAGRDVRGRSAGWPRARAASTCATPSHGRHVEADIGQQVIALINGGKVERIYPMSSGKPSTPTVLGHFRVYMRELGTNAKGMVDSSYFIRGYAIHGYADVPRVQREPRLPAHPGARRGVGLPLGPSRDARRHVPLEPR